LTHSDFDFKYGKNNIFHDNLSTFILPSRVYNSKSVSETSSKENKRNGMLCYCTDKTCPTLKQRKSLSIAARAREKGFLTNLSVAKITLYRWKMT